MSFPVQIVFNDLSRSDVIEATLHAMVARLANFHSHIRGCHITIELPRRHPHSGRLFNIRIDLALDDCNLVIDRNVHENIDLAIQNAFDGAYRTLEAHLLCNYVDTGDGRGQSM